MFIPTSFEMNERKQQHQFIHDNGFGVIISDTLQGTHLPFLLKENEGSHGTLYAHCAKENPHWKVLDNSEAMIIFTGPHSYISPSWYEKPPAVPTWNYSAVHAYGRVSLTDTDTTLEALDDLVEQYEPDLLVSRDILTDRIKVRLIPAIVGLKIELSHIEGKLKLGQQRSVADQKSVFHSLQRSDNLEDQLLANHMLKLSTGIG